MHLVTYVRIAIIFALISLLIAPSRAAVAALSSTPATVGDAYITQTFNVADGLPQSSVKDILQSRDGYLWVATEEGLARFDGLKFTDYNTRNSPGLASNNLHLILQDGIGDIWLLAGSGVVRYREGVFYNMTPDIDRSGDRINYIFKGADGKIYAISDTHLFRCEASGLTPIVVTKGFLNTAPWYFAEQPNGTIWISGGGRRMISVRGSVVRRYTVPGRAGEELGGMVVDKRGTLWVGGPGLWTVDEGGRLSRYLLPQVPAGRHVDALNCAPDGSLWFPLQGSLYRLVPGQSTAKYMAKPKGTVRWCAFDPDGTVWQLLPNELHDQIWCYDHGRTTYFAVPGPVTTEWTLPVRRGSEGSLWVGTYSGLVEFRKGRCRTYGREAGIPDGSVREAYQTHDGRVWLDIAGAKFGSLLNGRFTAATDPNLRGGIVASMAEDGDGTFWISTDNGRLWKAPTAKAGLKSASVDCRRLVDRFNSPVTALARGLDGSLWATDGLRLARIVHGKTTAVYVLPADSALGGHVYVIKPTRDGRIWLGGEKGFACLDRGRLRYYGTETGISSVPVIDICEDHTGELWLAFWGGGMARFKDGRVSTISLIDGLCSDSILSILEGLHDDLWLGTSNGIFSIDRSSLDRYFDSGRRTSFYCRSYTAEDGMLGLQCASGRQPVAFRALDGSLWFACLTGVVRASADEPTFFRNRSIPVSIENVVVDGRDLPVNTAGTARPGAGNLEFDYTGITFHEAAKVTFKYRLEGFEKSWVDAGSRRVAYYTHVPPGTYTFDVIACDANGNWNRVGASYTFTIKPHYYETVWFKLLLVALLLMATWGVAVGRSYRLQQQNRLLEERVEERTRDLGRANRELSASREEVVAQNEMLQSIQAELEAQNQELEDSRALLASQNEQLHEMKLVLELKNQSLGEANERLEDLATIDGLTALKNHRSFQVKLDTEIKFAARHNTPLSIVILDVDSFKSFNDTYGHPAGDEVLKQVARILSETARDSDFVARYGGEEFVVILPMTDSIGAAETAERLRAAIEEWPWTVRSITASFGVAALTFDVDNAAHFVDRADKALYQSKHNGKNRVTMYSASTAVRAS